MLAVVLVVLVIFAFLRSPRDGDRQRRRAGLADRHVRRDAADGLQPEQAVADGVDHRHGFVVDDAIVMIENMDRCRQP